MDAHLCPLRADGVVLRSGETDDGTAFLHDLRDGRRWLLNPTAALIWELCDGRHAPTDIAEALRFRFAVSARAAHADVARFVDELAALDLVDLREILAG